MKKKVGITDTNRVERYTEWFTNNDLLDDIEVVVLSNGSDDFKNCSGILLSGGIDVHPDMYDGSEEYPNADEHDISRDKYEEQVYNFAKKEQIPVLAICRGLQLVNVLEGGTLVQDLGDGNETHKKGAEDKVHHVVVSQGTLLAEVVGKTQGTVNSAHHQAVDPEAIARPLAVSAVSEAGGLGVIEALEFKDRRDKGFLLCVQWHPERMSDKEESPFSKNIKGAFLRAVRQYENQ